MRIAAGGAVDPRGGAARVMFFLPDRQPRLRLVDDVTAGIERGAAMFSCDAHPHGEISELQMTHAMDGGRS